MIAVCKRTSIVAMFALAVTIACARPAISAAPFSFPPTSFTIVKPDSGVAIGQAHYRIEGTPGGGILRGENGYYYGQTHVETAHIETTGVAVTPKLTELDHTSYNPDNTILNSGHV